MAAKTALQRCATVGPWLSERKAMARYAHVRISFMRKMERISRKGISIIYFREQVPLANFDSDWVLFIADMFLARALRDRQHVGEHLSFFSIFFCFLTCSHGMNLGSVDVR